jgi:hypothetical protein
MTGARALVRHAACGVLVAALVLWSVLPAATHAPAIVETIQDHLEMVADHGHSHGFVEDLMWAMHGHSHDAADHDHGQAVLTPPGGTGLALAVSRPRWRVPAIRGPTRAFRIERPPRA